MVVPASYITCSYITVQKRLTVSVLKAERKGLPGKP